MKETADFFRELEWSAAGAGFQVWAPAADEVHALFYLHGEGGAPYREEPMKPTGDGRWTLQMPPDIRGKYYVFRAKQGGVWRDPAPGLFAVATGVNGMRAAAVDLDDAAPKGWEADKTPESIHPSDAVIYEMHHRDFSASPDSGIRHKGKFLALTEQGTRTPYGAYSGLSHLVELGVTHVHLMPSFDFASVDESRSDQSRYNWGYDPLNYNVPEGSYATNVDDPLCRIREFRLMVMALHRAGLRVVLDVVYNHTYTVDGSNFERLAPGCFFRTLPDGTWANGSGCGNETASEREAVRRYMVESVCFWAKEYHVDGFRFDVMGLHDIETMGRIRDALQTVRPGMLLYGEGWSCSSAQIPAGDCALKMNMKRLPGIAAFGDELRDGLRGLWTDATDGGFLAGKGCCAESVRFGIVGGVDHPQVDYSRVNHSRKPWAGAPWQTVNYVSCHDDWCLSDRLSAVFPGLPFAERLKLYKLAETVLFTSQGIPFVFAGDEFLRSKHGDRNSYKSPDTVNAIVWRGKDIHSDVFRYFCELIRLRRAHPAFRLRTAEEVRKHLMFLPTFDEAVLAYRLTEEDGDGQIHYIYLFFNSSVHTRKVWIPNRSYKVLCRDGELSVHGLGRSRGGHLRVSSRSALILISQ